MNVTTNMYTAKKSEATIELEEQMKALEKPN